DRETPTLAAPVCQQPRGEAGIQNEANVGAAVAKAHDRVAVSEHRLGRRQVVVVVVDYRRVEEVAATILDEDVVGHFRGRTALARSNPRPGGGFLRPGGRRISKAGHLAPRHAPDRTAT